MISFVVHIYDDKNVSYNHLNKGCSTFFCQTDCKYIDFGITMK